LLVEPSAENSALQSENFTTTWAATNIAVSGNTTGTLDPYGTNLADLLTATASGSARVVQTFSFVSGTTYTYSCFAKAGNGFFGMTMENGSVASGVAVIWNVSTGAFSVSGSVGSGYTLQAHNIENYGNGWYRCSMRVLLGSTVTGNIRVNTSNGTMSSVVVQSDNGNSVNVFGAQVETGSIATSYIPTTTGSASRNAEVVDLSGAVSGCIGQTEGTLYAEVDTRIYTGISSRRIISLRVDGSNLISLEIVGSNGLSFIVASGGVNVSLAYTIPSDGVYKIAGAYNSAASGTVLYVNGVLRDTKTTAIPTLSAAVFGLGVRADGAAGSQFGDRIRAAALYTTRLTATELAALTTL
jgi:hypothetical protein